MIEIPKEFQAYQSIGFDLDNMRQLLELGRKIGRRKDAWRDSPPVERAE